VGFILLVAMVLLPAVIGFFGFAEDRTEELLFLKLVGYGILGVLLLWLGGFPLPVGLIIGLVIAGNAPVNRSARRAASVAAFLLMLLGRMM